MARLNDSRPDDWSDEELRSREDRGPGGRLVEDRPRSQQDLVAELVPHRGDDVEGLRNREGHLDDIDPACGQRLGHRDKLFAAGRADDGDDPAAKNTFDVLKSRHNRFEGWR